MRSRFALPGGVSSGATGPGLPFARVADNSSSNRKVAMKTLSVLPLVLVLASAGDLRAQDVRYNFDKDTNFSSFKTYKWVAIKGAATLGDLMDKQVKSAIDAELAKKGLTRSEADAVDLFIGYQPGIQKETEYTSFDTGWAYGPGWHRGGWYGPSGGISQGSTSTIYVGQLALDMYASGPRALVWRGVVSKTLDAQAKPDKQQKNLEKSVAKMLKNYPPPQQQAKKK
jgi:hypothetical protein